jgi:hypothetical protein
MSNKFTLKATAAAIGIAALAGATLLPQAASAASDTLIQLAASHAKNPCAANPCAAKNPCAANPCAAKNPRQVGIQDRAGKTHPGGPYQKQEP